MATAHFCHDTGRYGCYPVWGAGSWTRWSPFQFGLFCDSRTIWGPKGRGLPTQPPQICAYRTAAQGETVMHLGQHSSATALCLHRTPRSPSGTKRREPSLIRRQPPSPSRTLTVSSAAAVTNVWILAPRESQGHWRTCPPMAANPLPDLEVSDCLAYFPRKGKRDILFTHLFFPNKSRA